MGSNSLRIDSALFDTARQQGELMSRSAAQQIEHWARLGAALEATGMTVAQVGELLAHASRSGTGARTVPAAELWAVKRAKQARDLASVQSGQVPAEQMSWFSGGRAKSAKLVDSPY